MFQKMNQELQQQQQQRQASRICFFFFWQLEGFAAYATMSLSAAVGYAHACAEVTLHSHRIASQSTVLAEYVSSTLQTRKRCVVSASLLLLFSKKSRCFRAAAAIFSSPMPLCSCAAPVAVGSRGVIVGGAKAAEMYNPTNARRGENSH